MTPSETRILFALGARLHMSARDVEGLSVREIVGWVDFFTPAPADDGVPDIHSLSRAELRAMFPS
jgi:hypothetical protein